MSQSSQVAEVDAYRDRPDPSKKMAGNKPATCPHCGRTGKARRIAEHAETCHKRPN